MSDILVDACLIGFVVLPYAALSVRFFRPQSLPWWALIPLVIVFGWFLTLCGAALGETPDSGAGKVFALFFGWAYAVAWFIPALAIYAIVQLARRLMAIRKPLRRSAPS